MDWSSRARLPEPGKRHVYTLKVGQYARFPWSNVIVRIEHITPSGVTVSEEVEREIMGKKVKSRRRYIISSLTNVTKARPPR